MLPFFGNKQVPTISGKQPEPPRGVRPVATRRELRLILLGCACLMVIGIWTLRSRMPREQVPVDAAVAALPALREPLLADMPPLPTATELAAETALQAEQRSDGRPTLALGLDAAALAWGEALLVRDRQAPPLPQRVSGEDIARKAVERGAVAVVRGRLADLAPAAVPGREGGYRWATIALDHDQWLVALVPQEGPDLALNEEVQALGRFLGHLDVPTGQGPQATPFLLARVIDRIVPDDAPAGLKEFQGAVRVPADVYAGVDDDLPLLETRAYYYTLGQIKTEAALPSLFADAADANRVANEIHQRPEAYRGKPFTVRGIVFSAWEDHEVAVDRPFDIRRVLRILLYKSDWGPITENGATSTKNVLRLYEVAVVGDASAPKPGDYIEATGRFLKMRAMRVDTHPWLDQVRGVTRQSGSVYSFFFVATGWRPLPVQQVDWTIAKVGIPLFAGIIFVAMLWYVRRDRGAERRLHESVVRLRRTRRALQAKKGAAEPAQPAEAPAVPPADASPPAPPA